MFVVEKWGLGGGVERELRKVVRSEMEREVKWPP